MVEVFVDGRPVQVPEGSAAIQACELAGVEIPRFCYHERLAVAGNCRMCLVEVERAPKPVASCAMPVMPGMKIKTNTPLVHKAREGVMEFLLANHPLDCPVCDWGGECDLQDQSMRFGSDRSRQHEPTGRRAVENKNLGPLVKTSMNRCIQCTRCVRFANEVAGAEELGTTGRGNDMQIGTYIEKTLATEMSGNVIDLCPVGALTAKPYAFSYRAWELKRTESVDVMDAVGSAIRVDTRGTEVMRISPRENDDVNEEWISDKTRFAFDGLKRQRLTHPLMREGDRFVPCTWEAALGRVADAARAAQPEERIAVAGPFADAESLVALKDLFNRWDSEHLFLETNAPELVGQPAGFADLRANYLFNATIVGAEQADAVLFVGTNPRHEAAIINTRFRKAFLHNRCDFAAISPEMTLNYDCVNLGDSLAALTDAKHPFFERLRAAKHPMIVLGSGLLERPDAAQHALHAAHALAKTCTNAAPGWTAVNFLQRQASAAAAFDLGFAATTAAAAAKRPAAKFVYLLGADEVAPAALPADAFVVYQGSHGDAGAALADVVLPGAAYTEKSATYVNTEGRVQRVRAALTPPLAARDDWAILRALSEFAGTPLPYASVQGVRARLAEVAPSFAAPNVQAAQPTALAVAAAVAAKAKPSKAKAKALPAVTLPVTDFYLTDAISRNSRTMAQCSRAFTHQIAESAHEAHIAV
ncbi:hypothetical protein CXG81DRAFT_11039 [Caulochytrium protostelioides]|uniref:NADH-ubiquinone oxidoreductase 78 kDa subunit, mitochondrial n=1 Tax=Caulochytrium protostelioides TaxID=1555241 RepID=A0A4P9XA14_9FUNG|nr:hypothetical protein CXG81DRAFT_11039 [Caulochytrium protostelioides]|eukprot:RKP02204.1 hypothetical protein CXG81DRAFT_11039 [Caulochytrium protostelioides]